MKISRQNYTPPRIIIFTLITLTTLSMSILVSAVELDQSVNEVKYEKGKEVYMTYCGKCHGIKADGRGRMAALYRRMKVSQPSNFTVRFYQTRPTEYLKSVVRKGGEAYSLSEYMPPFGDELDEKVLDDVIYYIQSVSKVTFGK